MAQLPSPEMLGDDLHFIQTDDINYGPFTVEVSITEDGDYRVTGLLSETFADMVPKGAAPVETGDAIDAESQTLKDYFADPERMRILKDFLDQHFDASIDDEADVPFTLVFDAEKTLKFGASEADAVRLVRRATSLTKYLAHTDPGTFGSPYNGRLLTEALASYTPRSCNTSTEEGEQND